MLKLYILGRPGSGKSTVARLLATAVGCPILDDYPIVERLWRQDTRGRFAPYGASFVVLDATVYDEALVALDSIIQEHQGALIEFARADYDAALSQLSPAARADACYLFVDAPLALCKERLRARADYPLHKLDSYYRVQEPPTCVPCQRIENLGTLAELEQSVRAVLDAHREELAH